jgi:phosphate transport system substrate-binding protein
VTYNSFARLAMACVCAATLVACGQGSEKKAGGGVFTVVVDGSSTVFPISEAAGEAFQQEQKGRVRVTVAESGTGGGFRKFCRGELHVQGASRPISREELEACKAALTVVVHPENPVTSISVEELKKIWEPAAEGKITNWRQVNPAFPDMPLKLFGAGTASGTFDYFTDAVMGKAKSSRTDYTPTEDDNVTVQGVSGERGAMGYFGMAYLTGNTERVKALAVSHDGGPPVAPSAEAVMSGAYKPLARPIFIYVNAAALDIAPAKLFVDYYVGQASRFATQAGYVPLPPEAYATLVARVNARTIGTAFSGHLDPGEPVAQILARVPSTEMPAAKE